VVTKGIDSLERILQQHNGEDAVISISHKLYGGQKIKCELDCVIDANRIGFRAKNGQEVYMFKNDVEAFCTNNTLWFADDVMRVNIKFE